MTPLRVMLVAGEPSGDRLGADLVTSIRHEQAQAQAGGQVVFDENPQALRAPLGVRFFGAGGPRMAAAGVEIAVDLMPYAAVGLTEVFRHYRAFYRVFRQLLDLAGTLLPDVVILIDYGGFNLRFAAALRRAVRARQGQFHNWDPLVVQYVSPQVWASRPGRAYRMAASLDLLLSIIPFEREWYRERVPGLRVEFVGHPIVDQLRAPAVEGAPGNGSQEGLLVREVLGRPEVPLVLLLPGSRSQEVERHFPLMLQAARLLQRGRSLQFLAVLPREELARRARDLAQGTTGVEVRQGGLREGLASARIAIACSGTVTMECAAMEVPTVVVYRVSRLTYEVGKRLVTVPYIAMPNLLAGRLVFPEHIQAAAEPASIAMSAQAFLDDAGRREEVRVQLQAVKKMLGEPGASRRAARLVLALARTRGH